MKLIVLFGLPGSGKTYAGKVLEKEFGFYLHDGDQDLPEDMKTALLHNSLVTDDMRDKFFQQVIEATKQLEKSYTTIAVAQTFIKEKYRELFLKTFPHAKFILIQAPITVREKRLAKRKNYPIDEAYARNMVKMFEIPSIPHTVLVNEKEGEEEIKKQLQLLLSNR